MSDDGLINQSYADCYNKNRSSGNEQVASIIELISCYVGDVGSVSVLDVGSGPGRLAVPISKKVKKMVCVESDVLAISHLKKRVVESGVAVEIYAEKIQDLSTDDLGRFDLVMLSHIIHWFDVQSLLRLSGEFIKDNGYILLSYFDVDKLERMLFYKVSGEQVLKIQKESTVSTAHLECLLSEENYIIVNKSDVLTSVNYGNGVLEDIIKSAGTLAWKKLRYCSTENEYLAIRRTALNRLHSESCLLDIECRTMILAKKYGSSR